MAGPLDSIDKMPIWQRIVTFAVIAVLIVAVWYFIFWTASVASYGSATTALGKAKTELIALESRKANFLEEQREHEQREEEFTAKMEVLPMSASTIDNLMQTFQQQANIGGFSVETWSPEPEERQDFYARLPIKVLAKGSWGQTAEFFRKVAELKQIVSVENITLEVKRSSDDPGGHPQLDVEFEVATYRFLSDEERQSGPAKKARSRRKKGGKKK
ncbi:MAG: type 4a pilus biogenesis protein PilO [Nannocystaceae bacterium]|nr:type 4a pilus biogenesis protein PilO [Nannocystaceae bacterium]